MVGVAEQVGRGQDRPRRDLLGDVLRRDVAHLEVVALQGDQLRALLEQRAVVERLDVEVAVDVLREHLDHVRRGCPCRRRPPRSGRVGWPAPTRAARTRRRGWRWPGGRAAGHAGVDVHASSSLRVRQCEVRGRPARVRTCETPARGVIGTRPSVRGRPSPAPTWRTAPSRSGARERVEGLLRLVEAESLGDQRARRRSSWPLPSEWPAGTSGVPATSPITVTPLRMRSGADRRLAIEPEEHDPAVGRQPCRWPGRPSTDGWPPPPRGRTPGRRSAHGLAAPRPRGSR